MEERLNRRDPGRHFLSSSRFTSTSVPFAPSSIVTRQLEAESNREQKGRNKNLPRAGRDYKPCPRQAYLQNFVRGQPAHQDSSKTSSKVLLRQCVFTREKSVRVLENETVLISYCPKRNSRPINSFEGSKINPISSKATFTTQIYLPAKLLTMQLQARPINPDIGHHCLSSDMCHSIWTTGCNRYPAMPVSGRDNVCN
jgi:hypothetical protein